MIHSKTAVLECLFNKVSSLQSSNFIKERLQHRCFTVNIAEFLRTPISENICEQPLLLVVIFSQENSHLQRCLDLPGPKLHKKLTCLMLVHSTQTTFHRKTIYNFAWNLSGQKQSPRGVLRNIAKLTGKHLCQSLIFNKVAGLRYLRWLLLSGPTLQKENTCGMLAYG